MIPKARALLLLVAGWWFSTAAAQVPLAQAPAIDSVAATGAAPSEPVLFRHDLFYLDLASSFCVVSIPSSCRYPGPGGLTEDHVANRLPGVEFRRNGVPQQAGEYHWFGGDGGGLGYRFDGTPLSWEPLGFPPSGSLDPLLLPPMGDTLFLIALPLFGPRPAELVSWRNPDRPDSLLATALHANGPDGFSHTGGRLRGPIGGGFEFDGEFYRDFSGGQLVDAAGDGHQLDFELRRRVGGWPARIRFRQVRGERSMLFRWQESGLRADHRYLVADLDVEAARDDSTGEWLFRFGLRHEDQKLVNPLLPATRAWFGRTFSVAASRLWSQGRGPIVSVEGSWRPRNIDHATPQSKALDLGGLWRRPLAHVDFVLSGGLRFESSVEPAWRLALATSWLISPTQRVQAGLGRSLEAPSVLRRQLPSAIGVGGYAEDGRPDLGLSTHEAGSIAWIFSSPRLRVSLLGAAGRSTDVAAWPAEGTTSSSYSPVVRERRYSGIGGTASVGARGRATFEGGVDYTFSNRWQSGGSPAFAPKSSWYAQVSWPFALHGTHGTLIPAVRIQGAGGGTLPRDYAVFGAGVDLAVKRLLIFWRLANIADTDYRTGGAAFDYDRHFEYGFRWEFVN